MVDNGCDSAGLYMRSHFGVCAGTEQSCVAVTRLVLCCCFTLHRPWCFPTSSTRSFLRRSSLRLISLSAFTEARCSVSPRSWNKEDSLQHKLFSYLLEYQRLLWFCLLMHFVQLIIEKNSHPWATKAHSTQLCQHTGLLCAWVIPRRTAKAPGDSVLH